MKRIIHIGLILLFYFTKVIGQDIHYSQYYHSPLNLNPALAGLFDGDIRMIGNYRSQWSSVTVPYVTFSGACDFNILKTSKNKISGGILFNRDVAGDSKFGTTQIGFSLAFHQPINHSFKQLLSLGLQANYYQRSMDVNALYFESQYNGEMYIPSQASGEIFQTTNYNYFDLSGGVNWQYTYDDTKYYNVGVAMFHLNSSNQSFYGNSNVNLYRKFVIYTNNVFQLTEGLNFIPSIMFERQGNFSELVGGTSFMFKKHNENKAFYLSPSVRFNPSSLSFDAIILATKFDVKNVKVGISYDINISGLVPASYGQGGLEMAVIYIVKYDKVKKYKIKYNMCPVFL